MAEFDDGATRPVLKTGPFERPTGQPANSSSAGAPAGVCPTCGRKLGDVTAAPTVENGAAVGVFMIVALLGFFLGLAVGAFTGSFRYGLGVFALACLAGVIVAVGVHNRPKSQVTWP
jgi:hypothetical protein